MVTTFSFMALAVKEKVDRKSTRLNSSHLVISYAVFCLKKKTKHTLQDLRARVVLSTKRMAARHAPRLSPTPRAHPCARPPFDTCSPSSFFFFFNDTATTEIYTLSLHDALPI